MPCGERWSYSQFAHKLIQAIDDLRGMAGTGWGQGSLQTAGFRLESEEGLRPGVKSKHSLRSQGSATWSIASTPVQGRGWAPMWTPAHMLSLPDVQSQVVGGMGLFPRWPQTQGGSRAGTTRFPGT